MIDTNVLLDLFVFRDPRWQPLRAALEDGRLEAMTRSDCAREWEIVLGYAHLPLDQDSQAAAHAEFCRLLRPWSDTVVDSPLPVCKDSDDQKFLELARDCNAAALITKDKALLKLARWTRKRALFAILGPEQFQAQLAAG